jgi:predicted nucleotidyltransferase
VTSLLTEPVASTLIVLDETGSATLTEIARATRRPLSTIQRAVDRLVDADVIARETARGSFRFTPNAPRRALRDLADWRLGGEEARMISAAIRQGISSSYPSAPPTVRNVRVRAAWPEAIRSIVAAYRPARVLLFGSQARGDASPESDVDLLVIFDDDRDRRERRVGIRELLSHMPFAKDILVASTADVAHAAPGSVVATALRDGIVVYER